MISHFSFTKEATCTQVVVSRVWVIDSGANHVGIHTITQIPDSFLDDARGNHVGDALFPIDNPLGLTVKIDSDYYNVVGIMESEGFSNLGQNQAGSSNAAPSRVFIPFTSSKSRFGETTKGFDAGAGQRVVENADASITI